MLPPHRIHYGGENYVSLPDRAVSIPFPVIIVDVEMGKVRFEKCQAGTG